MKYTKYNDIPQYIQHGSYEIDVSPDRLIVNVEEWQRDQGLQLDPDFQRGHVWSEAQQIAYIEFFLRGGKTARVLYFNFPSWHHRQTTDYNDFVIVDGKQRYEAWRRFFANEIKAFGTYAKDYKDSMRIMKTMKVNINDLQTKAEVLQWYIDFNSGGVVHTDEEIGRVKRLLEKERALSNPKAGKTRRPKS
jgi:hypothetical protein